MATAPKREKHPALVARGQWIASLRDQKNLTQGDLADRVGVQSLQISRVETGRQPGSPQLLQSLARELGVSLVTLLNPPQPNERVEEGSPGRRVVVESAEFREAPEAVREWFLSLRPARGLSASKWFELLAMGFRLHEVGALHPDK